MGLATLSAQTSVPVMTGPTSPLGIVTQSGMLSTSYPGWKVFDGSDNSMWISAIGQTPAWISYSFGNGSKRVVSYAIKYVNGSILTRAPRNWTLEGWDGSSWIVVDSRTDQINWSGFEERTYTVASPGSYTTYRLNISDDNDPRSGIVVISIGKLSLLADDIDESLLLRRWHFDADHSTGGVDYYVPITTPVPILRFIPEMAFLQNYRFEKLMLAPNDAHYLAPGLWTLHDRQMSITIEDPRLGTLHESFTILTLTPDVLRIQR